MSSRKAIRHSVGCRVSCTATSELCCPREKSAGIRESPCSPPLEEWCGRPPRRPPRCSEKVARRIGPQKEGVCPLPPCCADPRASPFSTIPSTDKTVLSGWRSVRAWMACPTHSVPERLDRAYWNGAVARSTDATICLATALDTAFLNVSPTTMPLTPPVGLRKAVIRRRWIPFHHLNRHLRPYKLLSHLPQHLAVPNAVQDHFQVLSDHQ